MTEQQQSVLNLFFKNRGIKNREVFLNPDYGKNILSIDPFLLPDMELAVERITEAHQKQEKILIFGDYDADGVTATALMIEALKQFGFKNVSYYLPNRFTNGYGLTEAAVLEIAKAVNPDLIVTVDCGSLNHQEIALANSLGMDVIVTDHHNLADNHPSAIAIVNPRRTDSAYPNNNLAGVGVAFTLVRALQSRLDGLAQGQEKWLLDLVAIGTVADLMTLVDENRALVYFGIKVLAKTKRLGLREMLSHGSADSQTLNSETLGFAIAPKINASGRLNTADLALETLLESDLNLVKNKVLELDFLNQKRKALQEAIYQEALAQANNYQDDQVLVLTGVGWHEGVVGIVASKIMEKTHKPVFVLQSKNDLLKGSARSFGDFSIFLAIQNTRDLLITGGGHNAAGGVKLKESDLDEFRRRINKYYKSLKLIKQEDFLKPAPEVMLDDLACLDLKFYYELAKFQPFGVGNPKPIFRVNNLTFKRIKLLGDNNQHLKIDVEDGNFNGLSLIKFNFNKDWAKRLGDKIDLIFTLDLNTWRGQENLQGHILELL